MVENFQSVRDESALKDVMKDTTFCKSVEENIRKF